MSSNEVIRIVVPAAGIFLVLVGSWCVAYEVVNKFAGVSHRVSTGWGGSGTATKTDQYISWESQRNTIMWIGLLFITVGSLMQIYALFI